jgi:dienelactone hydrolase
VPAVSPAAGEPPAGIILVLHGGRSVSDEPVTPWQLTVLRMVPLARSLQRAARRSARRARAGAAPAQVRRPLFRLRGWNGPRADPVRDLEGWLSEIAAGSPAARVALVGHSMGARAALLAAGHPSVVAVVGLAPWVSPQDPVDQLAGRRVLLAHGDRDAVTSAEKTWTYASRARAITPVTTVPVRGDGHAMLRRAPTWHALAATFALDALASPLA